MAEKIVLKSFAGETHSTDYGVDGEQATYFASATVALVAPLTLVDTHETPAGDEPPGGGSREEEVAVGAMLSRRSPEEVRRLRDKLFFEVE